MDNVPLDLKKEIASYFNYETKLAARSTSRDWHQIVHITDYILYNITTEEWNEFVKRVSKLYSLDLRQNVFQDIDSLSQVVTKFTQLTSLKVEQFPSEHAIKPNPFDAAYFGQNYLLNCQRMLDMWLNLPSLRDITIVKDLSQDQLRKFRSLTNLERLSIHAEQPKLAPFELLTTDFKYLTKIDVFCDKEDFFVGGCSSIFNQIRELSWRKLDHAVPNYISLVDFTSLESLSFFNAPFNFINSSRLTSLAADTWNMESIMNSMSSLVNLKRLDARFTHRNEDYEFEFLTNLTDLESCNIYIHYDSEMVSYLNSTRLTHLRYSNQIPQDYSRDFLPLTRIPSLTSVDISIFKNEMISLSEAMQIQRLRLTIRGNNIIDLDLSNFHRLESLSISFGYPHPTQKQMRNVILTSTLTQLHLYQASQIGSVLDLSLLPDLKVLEVSQGSLDQFSGFDQLTKLEEFSFYPGRSSSSLYRSMDEISFLAKWTNLQTFSWSLQQSPLPYLVNAASNLQSLTISEWNLFENFDNLGVYTHLTYLELRGVPPKIDLTNSCLTRLTKLKVCCITLTDQTVTISNDKLRPYLPRLFN